MKNLIMHNEQAQTKKPTDEQARGKLILGRTWSDDKGFVYHCANTMLQQVEIFSIIKKKKVFQRSIPNFGTPLLIT